MRDGFTGPTGSASSLLESLEQRRLLSSAPPYANATDNDIAYDANGTLHVAWYDTQTGTLEYASRSASGVWSDEVTIDAIPNLPAGQPGVGSYVQLAIDSQNRPAVAYIDSYNADVKYASKDSSGNWVVKPTVETLGSLYPSLGFTTSDTPVISYYVTTAKDLKYARWNGTSWVKSTIDSTGDVGRSSSIQRIPGAADRFAVAYEYSSDGDFKYAELGTNGLWSTTTVDADPQAGGGFTSLAFDNNSNPSFSYYDSWIGTLKYASRNTSGTWTPTAISTRVSYYTNLWFNPVDGKGHLVYFDRSGNLLNHLTRTTSGTWTSPDAQLFLGGGNRVSAAFKTDGTIAYTWGPPITATTTPMGVGIQAGSIVTAPTIGTATAVSNARIDLTWTYPTNLSQTGFKIGVSTDGGRTFPDERLVTTASARSAQITGLQDGTTYTFCVRATNGSGDSSFSWMATATTIVNPPAAPGGLTATMGSTSQINLAWSDVSGETAYKVERSANGTSGWSQIVQLGANVTSYADSTGLSSGTAYYYRVRAANAGGDSAYSATASASTQIAAPASFTATAQSTTRINLAWADVVGENGYTIQQLVSGSYVDLATVAANVTSYSVADLTSATSYSFRVRATGAAGNNSAYTADGTATTASSTVADPSGTPAAEIHDSGATNDGGFGTALATQGNLILSGNPFLNGGIGGAVLIDATTGSVIRRFDNPATTPDTSDSFGLAVAFAGNRIAISAPDDAAGATPKVYIYDDLEDSVPDLVLSGTTQGGTGFGRVLAGFGNDLLVQETFVAGQSEGAVRRYDLAHGTVKQTFTSTYASDQIGNAIAVDAAANRILLTTFTDNTQGTNVLEFDTISGNIVREFAFAGAFNLSVAYGTDSIFIGDAHADTVYQFDRNAFANNPTPIHTYTGSAGTLFGTSLAVSGDRLLVTAPAQQIGITVLGITVGLGTGTAYIYDAGTFGLVQQIDDPTPDPLIHVGASDAFGQTTGVLGGGQFAIGDPFDDFNGFTDNGGVYTFSA